MTERTKSMWKVIGTVDGKETVLHQVKSLNAADKQVCAIYDDIENQSYLDWDEIYIRDPDGQLYLTDEVDGGWTCEDGIGGKLPG